MKKIYLTLVPFLVIFIIGGLNAQQHQGFPGHHTKAPAAVSHFTYVTQPASTQVKERSVLIDEDFSGGDFPAGWAVVGSGLENWSVEVTNYAGGDQPEAVFIYSPVFIGTSRLTTNTVSTAGMDALLLQFKHYLSDYVGDYTIKVETSSNGTIWNEAWSLYIPSGNGNVGPEDVTVAISTTDVGSATFQLAFTFDGNSDNTNNWNIDNVLLQERLIYDVTPIALTGVAEMMGPGETVTAGAVIFNLGSQPASFDVNFVINDGTSDVFTSTINVADLAPLGETTVTFDSWTAVEGYFIAYVTTLLGNDENPANDEISMEFAVQEGVLFYDNFAGGIEDWTVEGAGFDNWFVSSSNNAGGTVPELALAFSPLFTGTSRMVSPVINTEGNDVLSLNFKHFLDNYAGGFYLKVATTSDGSTWNDVWEIFVEDANNIGPIQELVMIENADVGSANFQFCFVYEDNSDYIDGWYIDNVMLRVPLMNDASAYNIQGFNPIMNVGVDVTPTAYVKNFGMATSTFDVEMTINDGTSNVYTSVMTVENLASMEEAQVTFDNWITTEGNFQAKVTAMLTGDQDPSNDSDSVQFTAINGVDRNLVIVEKGTGTWCGFCPGAAMGFADLLAAGYSVGLASYHSGDSYETPEAGARINYYGITGFPTAVFDGTEQVIGGSATSSMFDFYAPIVEERMTVPTPLDVQLASSSFDGTTFTAEVSLDVMSILAGENYVLHAILTESHIDEAWQNQLELNDVERMMLGGAAGTVVDLVGQPQQSVNIEFALDPGWIPQLCEVVVFVQDVDSKDILNGLVIPVEELTDFADITVLVNDNSGNPMSGASVTFGDLEETTDASGLAYFPDMEPGPYYYHAFKAGYLPGLSQSTVIQVDNQNLTTVLTLANLIFMEDFQDEFPPTGWFAGDNPDNWIQSNTVNAGGVAPELMFNWSPEFVGVSTFTSIMVDISGLSNASLMLKHRLSDYSGSGYALYIQASTNGDDWIDLWSMTSPANFGPELIVLPLGPVFLDAGFVEVRFKFEGDSYQTNYWAIDDVWIVEEIETGMPEIATGKILVYPNPASKVLHVINPGNSIIQLYNLTGQLLLSKESNVGDYQLDISGYPAGIYMVTVKSGSSQYSSKINIMR